MLERRAKVPALQRKQKVGEECWVEVYLHRIGPWSVSLKRGLFMYQKF